MGGGKEAVKEIGYDEALCRDRRSERRDISSRVWSLDVNGRRAGVLEKISLSPSAFIS